MPGGLHPHSHADSALLQVAVKLLRFPRTVAQLPFDILSRFPIEQSDLLHAQVVLE
jgi:hypothetical protein